MAEILYFGGPHDGKTVTLTDAQLIHGATFEINFSYPPMLRKPLGVNYECWVTESHSYAVIYVPKRARFEAHHRGMSSTNEGTRLK